jgi:PAS domain S-box-containing protein
MSIFIIAYISFITLALTLLVIHFRVWLSRKKDLDNLMFTLAALGAAFLAVMELLLFKTSSLEKYNVLIRLNHIPLYILIVSITWFVWFNFKTGRLWMAYTITALWSIGLIINFTIGDNLTFIELEGLKQIQTFTGETTYIPFGRVNPLSHFANLASLLFIIYVIDAMIRLVRKEDNRRAYTLGISIVFFMIVAGVQAPLIDFGILNTAYMISLPFAALLFAMSIQLTNDVIRISSLSEEIINKEARWSKLLNDVELPVIVVDKKGISTYVNPFFLYMTGFRSKEVIGKSWIKNFVPERSRKEFKESFSIPIKPDFPRHFENNILTKSGKELAISWSNVKIPDENNDVGGIIAVGNDVTERKEAFKKILELKQELEIENLALRGTFDETFNISNIVTNSDASRYAIQKAKEVAEVDTTVLLQGETGVGKGVYAKFIHEQSKRAGQTFLQINCAAIPSELLESELFGYEKGAFTGAVKRKKGRFELADHGTLFLDEIGELPGALQAKLLRVLQSGEFEPLGSEETKKTNVRIITATNRILAEEVRNGNFREDLYYRINIFPITIPPLRKRKEDIPELTEYFVHQFQKKYEKKITGISKHTHITFSEYNWPGNIRELQNVIERAVISTKGDTIRINDLLDGNSSISKPEQEQQKTTDLRLSEVEKAHIIKILDQCNWQIHGEKGAAEILDINPSTLRSRMKKLNIHNQRSNGN